MSATEKKALREQLRNNRVQRKSLNEKAAELKEQRVRLKNDHAALMKKAEQLGMKIGKKKAASA